MATPLLHRLPDGFESLGIGKSKGYELIKDGKLRVVKIGRRTLIAEEELQRFVRTLADQREA